MSVFNEGDVGNLVTIYKIVVDVKLLILIYYFTILTFVCSIFSFDFISVPLSHPRYKREFFSGPSKERDSPFTRSDLVLSSEGKISL